MVEQAAVPGSRRRHIRIRDSAYESLMQQKLDATIVWRDLAARGLRLAQRAKKPQPRRLEEMRLFYDFMEQEQVALMQRWREFRRSPER